MIIAIVIAYVFLWVLAGILYVFVGEVKDLGKNVEELYSQLIREKRTRAGGRRKGDIKNE